MSVLRYTPLCFRDVFVLLQLGGKSRGLCSVLQASVCKASGHIRKDVAFAQQRWPTSHPTGPLGLPPITATSSAESGSAGAAATPHPTSHPTGPVGLPPTHATSSASDGTASEPCATPPLSGPMLRTSTGQTSCSFGSSQVPRAPPLPSDQAQPLCWTESPSCQR